jgi:hypothetical protein
MNCTTEAHGRSLNIRWQLGSRRGVMNDLPVDWGMRGNEPISWDCRVAWRSHRLGVVLHSNQFPRELHLVIASDVTAARAHVFERRVHNADEMEIDRLWNQNPDQTLRQLIHAGWC